MSEICTLAYLFVAAAVVIDLSRAQKRRWVVPCFLLSSLMFLVIPCLICWVLARALPLSDFPRKEELSASFVLMGLGYVGFAAIGLTLGKLVARN